MVTCVQASRFMWLENTHFICLMFHDGLECTVSYYAQRLNMTRCLSCVTDLSHSMLGVVASSVLKMFIFILFMGDIINK